jgi:hypothetical protein
MMRRLPLLVGLFVMGLLSGACAPEGKDVPATQLIVRVSADASVISSLTTLRLRTAAQQNSIWTPRSERTYDKGSLNWPVDLVLALSDEGEAGRTFEVVLEAIDGSGQVLVQSRSLTSFVLRRAQLLSVVLTRCGAMPLGQLCAASDCIGDGCSTCVSGACAPTPLVPGQDLPPFTGPEIVDAGVDQISPDGSVDAAVSSKDGGVASDAGPSVDAATPTGPSDAGASNDAGTTTGMDAGTTADAAGTEAGGPTDSSTSNCEGSACAVGDGGDAGDAGDAGCTPGSPGCPPTGGCGSKPQCGANQMCVNNQCQCRTNAACPSGAANYCSGTNQYSCVADADGCLAPGPTTTCTVANECKEPTCATGTGCGSRNRSGGTRCSTGVCDGAGKCVQCMLDSDCRSGLVCDTRNKTCVVPECGDGLVTMPEEQCDPAASGTANDTWHCSPTCKRRTAYILCTSGGAECAAGYSCQSTSQGKSFCMPESGLGFSGVGVPSVACPPLTGYTQLFWSNAYCVISCSSAQNCPSQLSRCEDSPFAGAGQFEATKYCVPP